MMWSNEDYQINDDIAIGGKHPSPKKAQESKTAFFMSKIFSRSKLIAVCKVSSNPGPHQMISTKARPKEN